MQQELILYVTKGSTGKEMQNVFRNEVVCLKLKQVFFSFKYSCRIFKKWNNTMGRQYGHSIIHYISGFVSAVGIKTMGVHNILNCAVNSKD